MSRDSCQLCRATSHLAAHLCDVSGHRWRVSWDIVAFAGLFRHPGCDGRAVLAGVKAGALRVACGQP